MKLKFKKLNLDVVIPEYKTPGAAGMDVCATMDVKLQPGEHFLMPLGFALEIEPGYAAYLIPRSGAGCKGLNLKNTLGLIDSDYRGEVRCPIEYKGVRELMLHNSDLGDRISGFVARDYGYEVKKGARIAQLVIAPVIQAEIETVDELSSTERGCGGFGHTDKM
ncbi:dUTP diphosphatase [Vibrio breoganii]|uniref:dUTP diphosphatase n=1 Tax=Vibrio breoganii TaxID=553239 RepID=UPI000C828570|nr:dUTP diphosphatase [Vibrio breoganii]PMK30643.1 hypothetical protein BCU03_09505 [Vibrio breoganii]